MELFAGFEANGLSRGNADLGSGAWIAADAGLARTDAEDAEAAQFDAITGGEGGFEAFEDGVNGRLGFGSRQACPLDHVMDNILLDQCRRLVRSGLGGWIEVRLKRPSWQDARGVGARCQSGRTPIPLTT